MKSLTPDIGLDGNAPTTVHSLTRTSPWTDARSALLALWRTSQNLRAPPALAMDAVPQRPVVESLNRL